MPRVDLYGFPLPDDDALPTIHFPDPEEDDDDTLARNAVVAEYLRRRAEAMAEADGEPVSPPNPDGLHVPVVFEGEDDGAGTKASEDAQDFEGVEPEVVAAVQLAEQKASASEASQNGPGAEEGSQAVYDAAGKRLGELGAFGPLTDDVEEPLSMSGRRLTYGILSDDDVVVWKRRPSRTESNLLWRAIIEGRRVWVAAKTPHDLAYMYPAAIRRRRRLAMPGLGIRMRQGTYHGIEGTVIWRDDVEV